MKNHGLRRIFSLFLALFMVFTLLPTTALAEDTTGADETQPKTVAVDEGEKKTDPPAQEQPKDEDPPAPEEPKTFTVTYTDGADGAVFPNQVYRDLSSGTPTPAFDGTLAREGYTFAGWNPTVAGTVTADVTYAAKWEEGKTGPRRVTVPTIPGPDVDPAALDTGHKIDVRFTVLYVGDEFNIGYNYGSSEKTKFVCQYKTNHSDTAYNNHTIAISDIKAAAGRASVNSGYQIVGWSKESNANPTTWSLNKSGTTACNKGTTIYLVAKNPNPTTKYTYTLNYDANGGTGAPSADSWSTTDAAIRYHSFTVKNTIPTREGYVFKGWKANDGSDTIYTGGMTCAVSQYGNDVVKNGNTWTRTLYAVWEEDAPAQPTPLDEAGVKALLGENAVQIICTNEQIGHGSKTFGLIDGTFTVHQSNNRCEVVINSFSPYVNEFNAAVSVPAGTHITDNSMAGQNRTKINLVWSDGKWTAADAPAKHHVLCSLQPAPSSPPTFDELVNILGAEAVKVHCSTPNSGHTDATYPLLDGSFTVGAVGGSNGNYTCVVTVHADQYVTAYGNGHTLAGANESPKTITLKYNETAKKWERPSSLPITFNVACDNAVPPVAPSEAEVAAMDIWVTVICTKNHANHPDVMSPLTEESIVRIGDVQTNPVSGEHTCTVEVNSSDYVTQFDKTHGYAVHRPTGKSGYIDLTYSKEANRWVAPASPYNVITFQVKCVTSPTFNDLKTIFNQNIHVDCTTESMHTEALYDLIENSYVINDYTPYTPATDNPTCTVIIRPRLYVEEYNTSFGAHATDSEGKSIALYYADNGWTAAEGAVPVVFKVKCNTEIVPPPKPDDEKLGELDAPVKVVCTTKPETHAAAQFSLSNGTYTIGNVVGNETDGYTCDITVTADRYVAWYNLDYGKHTLPGDNTKTLTLKYVEGRWAVDTPVTFPVECGTAPETTYTVTYTDGVENEEIFADQVYGNLLSGTATPAFNGTPTRAGYKFLGWEPTVAETVTESATYVAQWEKLYTVTYTDGVGGKAFKDDVHSDLEKDTKTPAYKDGIPTRKGFKFLGWEPEVADTVTEDVTYTAKWGELYTVTYTDGAKGKAFEDQVYENVLSGTKTPKFDGTPTREGYKFVGWEPEVAETVTKDVTYTAKWEKLYTVTYTDGAKGKAFKDQVYSDLEAGTDTPKFDGKPTRKGYTFTGWSPKVTDTVTKDVTYVAQWKSVKNGKDNIPKTGDSEIVMVLGSVLLFSFCGAAAVSVYDRKRKHF